MSGSRPLRGGCQCGRNKYVISLPEDGIRDAQVLFNTEPHHQIPLATPLAAYIRVPLSWYHSTTFAFFPDETHSMIRRVYTHPSQDHSKRHFCGFCGTPLSYWSEEPQSEADFINLTLGSLLQEDMRDLEDLGLIPEGSEEDVAEGRSAPVTASKSTVLKQSFGVPWFESLVEGSRLGNIRRSHGSKRSHDGNVKIEWDVVEYTDNGAGNSDDVDVDVDVDVDAEISQTGKRKLGERDE